MSKQYAFPTHTLNVPFAEADDPKHNGMELRDYFAAMAMQGFTTHGGLILDGKQAYVAQEAYALADAMLEERAK
jgi:hypothetical protein